LQKIRFWRRVANSAGTKTQLRGVIERQVT